MTNSIPRQEAQRQIINYLAASLASGTHTSVPSWTEPTIRESQAIKAVWDELYDDASRRRQLGAFRPKLRSVNREMEGTVGNLRVHSLVLEQDPNLGTTVEHILSFLPDVSEEIGSLLSHPPFEPFGHTDAQVLSLVKWFKSSFMRWIDPIPCPLCSGPTTSTGSAQPTPKERADGGGRVEIHRCNNGSCGGIRRFVRYGKVSTLLSTREGRCGEFAHLFYVFLRAAGVESRYIWNSEDHVWCEYWSEELKHWVHVDPSEGVTNKAFLYAKGWGKKQAFCLAFGPYGAEDVTRAYIDDWDACQSRRRAKGWKEWDLRRALYEHTLNLRFRMTPAERDRLATLDQLQSHWVGDEPRRLAEAERMELGGRVSGPEEWRAMRDELGTKVVVKPTIASSETVQIPKSKIRVFGTAELTSEGGVTLTTGPSQTGAIFLPTKIGQDRDFRFAMTFRLVSPPGAGEADGIAIVFAREAKLGEGGYGLGYSGLGGAGDFAVEIDTYRTQDYANDPPTPHLSVQSPPHAHHRHSISCTQPNQIPYLSDGRAYDLELFYQGSSGSRRLRGYLRALGQEGEEGVEVGVCDVRVPPGEGEGGGWYVGMTGSCGGLWQKQEILTWQLDFVTYAQDEQEQTKDTEGT